MASLFVLPPAQELSRDDSCTMMTSFEGAPLLGGAWARVDVMELAGRLGEQHTQELKEVLRLPGDRANQARTKLQALASLLQHIFGNSNTTNSNAEDETGGESVMAVEGEGERHTPEEVSLRPCGAIQVEVIAGPTSRH
jgi:hypothetical protein